MVKVLVADENIKRTAKCCQYLSCNDSMLETTPANTGIDTLNKYNAIKADILILNSRFSDIKSTEIIDRLSSTVYEQKNNKRHCYKNNNIINHNRSFYKLCFCN